MKKINLAALVLVFLLLCACNKSDPAETPAATDSPNPVTEAPELTPEPPGGPLPGQYVFREDTFPLMDGSTSQVPLAQAVMSTLLGIDSESAETAISFNRTSESFRNLMYGYNDIIISAEPAETVWQEYEQYEFQYEIAHIATDALIFVVNENNPVESLTTVQIQKIYSGEITNWSQVGGNDVPIVPFQRNPESGSQSAMERLVMTDIKLIKPDTEYIMDSMMGLMEAVKGFDNSAGAIGYSVYYYANDMRMAQGLKIIAVDGIQPDTDTIGESLYPHLIPTYTVIDADKPEDSPAVMLFHWLQGTDGQALISSLGYVPVNVIFDAPDVYVYKKIQAPAPVEPVGTRLSEKPLIELVPSDNYGILLPYMGERIPPIIGENYAIGAKYGLVTEDGIVITDPIYNNVSHALANDNPRGLGMLILEKIVPDDDNRNGYSCKTAIAAADGSWITGFDFVDTINCDIGVIGIRSYEGFSSICYNRFGEVLFDTRDWNIPNAYLPNPYAPLSEGYIGLEIYGENNEYEYFFFDFDGNRYRASGMTYSSGFSDGLACAQNEAGLCGYIDTDFQWVIEPIYANADNFYFDYACVTRQDETCAVIDKNGNTKLKLGKGQVFCESYFYEPLYVFHPADGQPQYFDQNLAPVDYGTFMTGGIAGAVEIYQSEGGLFVAALPNNEFAVYDTNHNRVLSSPSFLSLMTDTITGELYIFEWSDYGNRGACYDKSGTLIVSGTDFSNPVNGLFYYQTSLYSGYKNLKNEWVFKTPIKEIDD